LKLLVRLVQSKPTTLNAG